MCLPTEAWISRNLLFVTPLKVKFLKLEILYVKRQCVDIIFGFSAFSKITNPLINSFIDGQPFVQISMQKSDDILDFS